MGRTTKRSPLKSAVIVAALAIPALFLLCTAVFYLVPDELIEGRLKEAADRAGVAFTQKSFSKAFPFGIELRAVEVSGRGGGRLVLLDRLRVRVNPLSLLVGRVSAYIDGDAGEGGFTGHAVLRRTGAELKARASGIDLRYLPAVSSASSIRLGSGLIDAQVYLKVAGSGCPEGEASFNGYRMEGSEVRVMGYPLPFGPIEGAGAKVELKGCKAMVEGVWIEGRDLSARLKGEVTAMRNPLSSSPVDMTLEVTARGGLAGQGSVLALLGNYRKSASFYSIPVRGTIGAPVVGM